MVRETDRESERQGREKQSISISTIKSNSPDSKAVSGCIVSEAVALTPSIVPIVSCTHT